MIGSPNPEQNCNCGEFKDITLRNGCENFLSLGWNNPEVQYEEVECPDELKKSPPCWKDNGEKWPVHPPALCLA